MDWLQQLATFLQNHGMGILLAIIVFIVGMIITKIIKKIVKRALAKSTIETTAHKLIIQILDIVLKFAVMLIVAETVGIKATSLIAIFSAIGVAISLALKDSLSNVAGGFLVLFTKPFVKGNFIETNSVSGTVDNITLFYTVLKTPDNKTVYVPNGEISTAKIVNYSAEETRRLDLTFTIGYNDDMLQAKSILETVARNSGYMLDEPAPTFAVLEYGDHAIKLSCRFWLESKNYWTAYFYMLEKVKPEFDKAGITIPYNQLDLHIENLESIKKD